MSDHQFTQCAYIGTLASVDDFKQLEEDETWQIRTALIWLYHRPKRQKRIFRDFHKKHGCIMFVTLQLTEKMTFQALKPFSYQIDPRNLNRIKYCLAYLAAVLLEIQANIAKNEEIMLDEVTILNMVVKLTNIFQQWHYSFRNNEKVPALPALQQGLFINEMIQKKKKFSLRAVRKIFS